MKTAAVQSRCECQATLGATLDEGRRVLSGWARATSGGRQELAPAHCIGAAGERFDVSWLCPCCGRNSLRSFEAGALSFVQAPAA
jgi:hypothetical protein